jgi:ABC-type transport system involved in multi-copper enzyme maturation permease subunit
MNQLKAELLKIRSTKTTLGLLIGLVLLALLFTILVGTLSPTNQMIGEANEISFLSFGSIAGVFSALAGIMLVTSEIRFGTIRPTFLFNPNRNRLFASKIVAGAIAGFIFAVISEGLVYVLGIIILKARHIPFAMSASNITELLVATIIGTALWGAIGVGLGSIVPNQVGAVISLLAWGFVVENLVFGLLPSVGRFLPVHAEDATEGIRAATENHLLPAGAGWLILILWTAALAAIGLTMFKKRDIS